VKILRTAMVGGGALALTLACATSASAAESYQVDLGALNNSGATGTAVLTLDGNNLNVKINSKGLVPNAPHAQHLHGSTDLAMDFHCPTMAADKDGSGIVTTAEGVPDYGDINISLTTTGDTSADSGLAVDRFPTADAAGNLAYDRTIEISDAAVAAIKNLHVVQHGIDVNKNGTYDTDAGPSELDPTLPQEATAPADCGMIMGSNVSTMPMGGVQTDGGDTTGVDTSALVGGTGALVAAAAGGLFLSRRRSARAER